MCVSITFPRKWCFHELCWIRNARTSPCVSGLVPAKFYYKKMETCKMGLGFRSLGVCPWMGPSLSSAPTPATHTFSLYRQNLSYLLCMLGCLSPSDPSASACGTLGFWRAYCHTKYFKSLEIEPRPLHTRGKHTTNWTTHTGPSFSCLSRLWRRALLHWVSLAFDTLPCHRTKMHRTKWLWGNKPCLF